VRCRLWLSSLCRCSRRAALAVLLGVGFVIGCGGSGGHADRGSTPATGRHAAPSAHAAPAGISVLQRRRLDPRLAEWTLKTPALRDPTHVRVLLPAGYRADRRRRYPVLYLLHGADADSEHGRATATPSRSPRAPS
jgi:putative esterase